VGQQTISYDGPSFSCVLPSTMVLPSVVFQILPGRNVWTFSIQPQFVDAANIACITYHCWVCSLGYVRSSILVPKYYSANVGYVLSSFVWALSELFWKRSLEIVNCLEIRNLVTE